MNAKLEREILLFDPALNHRDFERSAVSHIRWRNYNSTGGTCQQQIAKKHECAELLRFSHESLREGCYGASHMEANEAWRQRAQRLLKLGINQKVVAGKMGMTPSTFNRWINNTGADELGVNEAQRLEAFEHELFLALQETQRPTSQTEPRFSEPSTRRRNEADDRRHA